MRLIPNGQLKASDMVPESDKGGFEETRSIRVLSPGAVISHYRIVEKIGVGGMGVVYKAEDTKLKRHVALKFLPPHLTQDEEAKRRFMHEAQSASAIEHSNICTIHEIDETDDGQMFISMACYEGETLRTRLERGPLPVDEALDIAAQVAEGLREAHKKEIVHRDIKPANLIITPQGQVKIMDFGLAKLAGRTRLTRTGTAMGTVAYMSPEQARGEEVDQRSDVWALGVVLYEMLTGSLPFRGEYEQATVYSILNDEPERITRISPEVPDDLERVVTKALQKNPSQRYESSDALLADLQRLRTGDRVHVWLPRSKPLSKRLVPIIAAAAVVIAAIALWPRLTQWFSPTQATATTLAVVDFDNISGEEAGHLAVGLAEGICVKLSKVAGIQVVSSDDIRRLRRDDLPAKEIALRLGAKYAVGGSLLKSGEKIRVTPQLIEASTGNVVWSELFDREFDDVFVFMDEVSVKIVDALKIKFSQDDRLALRERPTDSPQAYDHYLKGRHHYLRETVADNELAAKEFQKALSIDPDYPLALAGLADAYVQRYRESYDYDEYWLDQADSLITRALGFESDLAEAYKSRAAVLLEKEHLLAALEAAEKAKTLRPDWDEPYVQLGVIYQARGETRHALKMYDQALAIRPSVRAWCGKGEILLARGHVDSAEMAYQAALEHNPHSADPYLHLGWHYDDLGRRTEADSMFRAAIRVRPDHARGYLELGWLLSGEGRVQEARDMLRGFVDRYPYNWEGYDALFEIVAWSIGDYASAIAVVEEAVARNPDRVWPHLLLASSYAWEMGQAAQPEQAVAAIDKALALRPESSRVLRWAGQVYASMGERKKALEYYQQALELNPGGVGILNDLALNLQEAGRNEDALTYALKAREQAPGIVKEWRWDSYDILLTVMPFLDKADEYFEIIKTATAKYGPDNPTFYIYLGKEQCMRGEFGEAITSYRRALEIKESHRALMGLGAAQWLSGDTDGALVSLRAARGPGNEQPYVHEGRLIALLKFLGRFEDIEQHLEMLRTEGKTDLWFWRAVDYYASMRRFDEAIALGAEMYENAEATWRDDILWDRATWYRKKGDLGKALALLEEAKATLPTVYDSGYYGELAVIAAIRGRLDEAEKFARLAVQTSVRDWRWEDHLRLLARLQYADGRMDEAMSTLASAERTTVYWMLHSGYFRAQLKAVSQSPYPEDELRKVLYLATRLARDDRGHAYGFARRYCALASARLGDRQRAGDEAAYALRLEPESADMAYVAACTHSLCGDTDQALDWLETAVERGHQDLWWARVDPDLDPLRDLPRFKGIMADWDTRIQALR